MRNCITHTHCNDYIQQLDMHAHIDVVATCVVGLTIIRIMLSHNYVYTKFKPWPNFGLQVVLDPTTTNPTNH